MRLSRFGFNVLVLIWVAPVLLFDIIGNTTTTGFASDIYYWKALTDIAVAAIAGCFVIFNKGAVATQEAKDDEGETVASFAKLWLIEPYYCLVLAIYSAISWWELYQVNKNSTGLVSFASMVWSFVCLVVIVLCVTQFYNLKSKILSELSKKMVNQQ